MNILENTPHSLKLRSTMIGGYIAGLIFGSIMFLISGFYLVFLVVFADFGEDWSILIQAVGLPSLPSHEDADFGEDWPTLILIGSLTLFVNVMGAFLVRGMLSLGHACILHFDQTTKKLNLYPQSIFRKLPVEEIPFAQLEKIEIKEKLNTNDDNKKYLTYTLTLKAKDEFVSTTATLSAWSTLWRVGESQRHEVEEVARLISEITEIPYTFSTDKPLPEKP